MPRNDVMGAEYVRAYGCLREVEGGKEKKNGSGRDS